ncbi:hypothetical protein [Pseudomonas sp. S09G 359]|jgi:hypothetical protein|uniref:hypothetical protein n=1 Tax=Pseudomonas sp. S09G 359 TaxID=2054919 RepID=UPI0015A8E7E7|nr:hypothetical protein [Pseudomonas sp. S09G 359]
MVAAASEIILFGKRGSQAWPVAKVSRDPVSGEELIVTGLRLCSLMGRFLGRLVAGSQARLPISYCWLWPIPIESISWLTAPAVGTHSAFLHSWIIGYKNSKGAADAICPRLR